MSNRVSAPPGILRRAWSRLAGGPGSLRSQLVHGATGTGAIGIAQRLLQLATVILLARLLGAEGYGVYAYAASLVMLLAVPAQLGLPQLIVREVAGNYESGRWDLIRGLMRRAAQASAVFAGVMLGAGMLLGHMLSERIEALDWSTFIWALALIPLGAYAAIQSAALRGLHHVVKGQLSEGLFRPLGFFLLIVTCYLIFGSMAPYGAMMLGVLATTLATIIGAWLLWRVLPAEFYNSRPKYQTLNWTRSVLPFTLLAGIQTINNYTDIVMLGLFTSSTDVGIYRVISFGAALVALPLVTVNAVLAPKIAGLYASGDHFRLQRLMTASARYMLLLAVPIVVCLTVLGNPILAAVFGAEFRAGAVPLVILCVAQLANVGMGSVALFLNMTGHEADTTRILGGAAIANILLNLVLIPPLGMLGAALATGMALVAWNIMLAMFVRRRLYLKPGAI